VVIDERYCGPPDSANGGYACAMVARELDGPAEVTLRSPPPLGRPLRVEADGDRMLLLGGEGQLIAEGRPARVEVEVPETVSLEAAVRAASRYPWREHHPYPTCFVCGPRREAGDGLEIFPGPVEGAEVYAAPWTPDPSLGDVDGHVRPEFVWGALDCPGGIVTDLFGGVGRILLGRLSADLRLPVVAGRDHIVQAWPISRQGRKMHTATALFAADGTLCAVAVAVWIEVPGARP
jgi:hypothetical protein